MVVSWWASWAVAVAGELAPEDPAAASFLAAIRRMETASAAVSDATFTLHQAERIGSKWTVAEPAFVKYRPDHTLYMRWGDAEKPSRQVLFSPGWNNDQLRVDPGPLLPTLNLDPRGRLARHGQRHTLYEVGFSASVKLFAESLAKIEANPATMPAVTELPPEVVHGEPAHCWDAALRRDVDPTFYADRIVVCTGLPVKIVAWAREGGEDPVQVEQYGFADVRLNPGLSDSDFSPETYGL